jgi:signal transduction histidine kinase/DNA-binding LacI/PurR family transcriptional regulator
MEYIRPAITIKKSGFNIGFLDENLDNEFRSQMMPGVFEAAGKYKVNVIRFAYYPLHSAYSYTSQVNMILNLIDQYDLRGLMFLGWGRAGALQNYENFIPRFQSIPILSIGTKFETIPHVYCPGEVHIREILIHLINHHHINRIAYIAPIIPDKRNDAYLDTMREHGIYDPDLYIGEKELGGLTMSERARRTLAILLDERRVDFRAIMSLYSEETAFIAEELDKRGIHVPNDVALTSYEDRDITKYSSPPLTTVYFPWVELGFYGCEKMIELLTHGHIPLSTEIPGKVIYRYSCGCMSKSVKMAGMASIQGVAKTPAKITPDEQRKVIAGLEAALPNSGLNFQRLLETFFNDFQNKAGRSFLTELAIQLQKIEYSYRNTQMEDLISVFRGAVFPYMAGQKEALLWSGDLFQQAQVLTWEKITSLSNREKVHAKILNQGLQEISQILITNFSLENLLNSLTKSLYKLNIPGCYIFKFNSRNDHQAQDHHEHAYQKHPEDPFDDCMMVYEYRNYNRVNLKTNRVGPARQLLEEVFTSEDRVYKFLAHLIHTTDEIIGFVLFEPGPMDDRIYQALAAHISIAFQGSMLLEKLESSYQKLAEQAHREGMADISSEILHNTGNILNSVNASVHLMKDVIDNSAINDLIKANRMLEENLDDIEDFINHNPKGKKLFHFYIGLGSSFTELQNQLLHYINRLDNKVQSINEIIAAQQNYAGVIEIMEELDITSVVNDAIKLFSESLDNYRIQVVKEYRDVPKVMAQRMKLFPILINIISNAEEAMFDNPEKERKLIFTIHGDSQGKYIRVTDNGCGIPADSLDKIFKNGSVIQNDHYGFGLYRCAKYMSEMGGKIWAESPGPGKGTTIVIQFKN